MSDDVKVKFGGDFTDIAKGAGAAAKHAGNMLETSVTNYATGLAGSIGSMFTLESIVEKIQEGFKGAAEYFKEVSRGIKTSGVNAEEFQKIVEMGKPVGMTDIGTISKGLGIFEKNISSAAKGAESYRKVLRELGFSNEEITNGTISATAALQALAKQWESPSLRKNVASNLGTLFGGKSGKEFKPIVQAGSAYINQQLRDAKVFSQAQIEITDAAEREEARRSGRSKKFFKNAEMRLDYEKTLGVMTGALAETQTAFDKAGKKDVAQTSTEFLDAYIENLKGKGVTLRATLEIIRSLTEGGEYSHAAERKSIDFRKNIMGALGQRGAKLMQEQVPDLVESEIGRTALTASSLQAIGGGDVNSVMAASYQAEILDATKQVAENTRKLVEGTTPGAQPPAKAGR